MKVPYHISDRTISFFAKGRPWSVSSENANFGEIRKFLLQGVDTITEPNLINMLVEFADEKSRLTAGSNGVLTFNDQEELVFDGHVLHNAWTKKIEEFRKAGEPFEPIFNALQDLMSNPTPQAIERLPIFLERVDSGFLPDGRCTAYKSVKDDYYDRHSGQVRYKVGDKPTMDRKDVNPDPNETCAAGLHLGSLEYIDGMYHGGHVMFVAFWPHDVVAVPVDYNGSKMRVCAMEVLDEVDPNFVTDFRNRNRQTISGYVFPKSEPVAEEESVIENANVGDWINVNDGEVLKVIRVPGDGNLVLRSREGDEFRVDEDDDLEIVAAPAPWLQAYEGCYVTIKDHPYLKDGEYKVEIVYNGNDGPNEEGFQITVSANGEALELVNRYVVGVTDA